MATESLSIKRRRGLKNLEKIKRIVNKEFQKEFDLRDKQLELLQQRINQAQKTLHVLRYAIVNTYYRNADRNRTTLTVQGEVAANPQTTHQPVHPAVKKLLADFKSDAFNTTNIPYTRRVKQSSTTRNKAPSSTNITQTNLEIKRELDTEQLSKQIKTEVSETLGEVNLKDTHVGEYCTNYNAPRNRSKKDHIVVVGNISKWTPAESEEDGSTHKWMVYVRGPKGDPNISGFVQKVVFYLHPSYKPNDVVELKSHPFHLSRRGWGEFPLRVRIYFVNTLNKPVDVVHHLKLDSTFTGRQTLGNETIVNLQLYTQEKSIKKETIIKEDPIDSNCLENDYCDTKVDIKKEFIEDCMSVVNLDHSYCSRGIVTPTLKQIDQPENELIYGLKFENIGSVPETTTLESVTRTLPIKANVNTVVPSTSKRKAEELPITNLSEKKLRLCNSNYTKSSQFHIIVTKRNFKNVLQVLPYLFKHMPMITKSASNNMYKCTYPYAATSLEEYKRWNIGRRLSSEWFQAKTILSVIKTNQIPDWENWTTKKIILYARAHGYTPLANYAIFKGNSPDYQYDYIPNGVTIKDLKPIVPAEEVVDVIGTKKVAEKQEKPSKVTQLIDLNLQKVSSYIRHAVLDVGIILKPEEIIPGVLFNATEQMLLKAILCLSEDIIRKAKAKLVNKGNFREDSSIITINDICDVLTSRSEFSLLYQPDVR